MYNPFKENRTEEKHDKDLVTSALRGDLSSLESLILRHQSWIYNIALRMSCDPNDAEDITQDVLIKVITKLSSYDTGKASLRTWIYHIVVNHILNMKRSDNEAVFPQLVREETFDDYAACIPDRRKLSLPDTGIIQEEVKLSCVNCILLLLNRRERMIFLLGVMFNVPDYIGSEICGVSKDNYRKIISRSRKKLYNFFIKNCSLMNENNPCKCSDKISAMDRLDLIDTENLQLDKDSLGNIREIIYDRIQDLEDSYYEFHSLFMDQPFFSSPDMTVWLRDLVNRHDLRYFFSHNN